MPVSRTRTRMMWCPGCNLRCWAGAKRLERHRRNQCRHQSARYGKAMKPIMRREKYD